MTAEEIKEYNRRYYQANREKIKARSKKYRIEHPDDIKEYKKNYYLEHPDKIKQYRIEHSDNINAYNKMYKQTPKGRASYLSYDYVRTDKAKGLDVSENITTDWILKNIFTDACVYCGEDDWTKLGADRIDNDKPHTADNVVCSCWDCNNERGNRYTFEEFKKMKERK